MDIQDLLDWARNRNPVVALTAFCLVNILGTSVLPVPIGVWMMILAGILYGQVGGLTIYLSTCVVGACITFGVVRLLRDRLLSLLKPEHLEIWHKLDAAITREGLWICFLWRVAPIAPFVVSSAMISMTDITMWDYLWTTSLGIIPSSFPIVSGAALAGTMLLEKKEVSPTTLAINIISFAAGVYVMIRLGAIAMEVIRDNGLTGGEEKEKEAGSSSNSNGDGNGGSDERPPPIEPGDNNAIEEGVSSYTPTAALRRWTQLSNVHGAFVRLSRSISSEGEKLATGVASGATGLVEGTTGLVEGVASSSSEGLEKLASGVASGTRTILEGTKGVVTGVVDESFKRVSSSLENLTKLVDTSTAESSSSTVADLVGGEAPAPTPVFGKGSKALV